MKISSTSDDSRRLAFVESLYKQLRQQTQVAIEEHDQIIATASAYLDDGLTDSECLELLVIDGVPRDSAKGYIEAAQSSESQLIGRQEYNFQFEDATGKIWSSHDIGKTVFASSDEEAWALAESDIFSDSSIEPERVVSVGRI